MPEVPDLIFLATTPWDGTPLTERHLAARLASSRRVLYVEPPVSAGRSGWGAAGGRVRRAAEGAVVLTPRSLPCRDRAWGWRLSRRIVARQIRRAADRLGMDRPLLVEFALHRDVAGLVGERATVAYLKDAGAAAGALIGVPASRLQACEDRALARAALVVTPSPELAVEARARTRAEVLVLPPGCDAARPLAIRPDPRALPIPGPRIGMVGTLNARIDWRLVSGLARLRPGWSILLAGPRSRLDADDALRALELPNVHELGPMSPAEVPALLAALDAAIVPYRTADPFNSRSTPLKTLEFIAASLPVVATPIPAHGRLAPVRLATDAPTFAAALEDELAGDSPARRAARRVFAADNDWSRRCALLDGALRRAAEARA